MKRKIKKVTVSKPVIKKPKLRWFAFDTETTGLVENRKLSLDRLPEIVEFYGVEFDPVSGEMFREINQLIKPRKSMNAEQISHHMITNEMLANEPVFAFVAPRIKEFIEGQSLVFAHNLSFDMDMVDIEFERLEQKIAWPRRLCTVEQTIHLRGHRLSLTKLHEHLFKTPFSGAHRAKVDVAALVRCICELHKLGEL